MATSRAEGGGRLPFEATAGATPPFYWGPAWRLGARVRGRRRNLRDYGSAPERSTGPATGRAAEARARSTGMTPTSTLPSGGVPFPQPTRQDFVGLRPWRRVCDRAKSPHTAIYDRARDVREIRSPDVSRQTAA